MIESSRNEIMFTAYGMMFYFMNFFLRASDGGKIFLMIVIAIVMAI